MYSNDLLDEKYKTQKRLYHEANNNHEDYFDFVEKKVKTLFREKLWNLSFSKRKGGYIETDSPN